MEPEPFFDQKIDFSDSSALLECINFFGRDKEYLNEKDFDVLTRSLIRSDKGDPHELSTATTAEFFSTFDRNKDHKIDIEEFKNVWNNWIKPLVQPVVAFLVIDVQNDFIDGSMALKNWPGKRGGCDVVPVINDLLDKVEFDFVVYSLDYHPVDHISFFENIKYHKLSDKHKTSDINVFSTVTFEGPPEVEQILWPRHCVPNTWGSQLHPDLKVAENSLLVHKGTNPKVDSYSAFWDNMKLSQTILNEELKRRNVTHVFVCGIALDFCVGSTALHALEFGYATTLVLDAIKVIDVNNEATMLKKLASEHCVVANSDEVGCLATGRDIRKEFACVFEKRAKEVYECVP